MVSTAMAARVVSEALVPCSSNSCSWYCDPPTSRHKPTMPLRMIMTAANTVSRARAVESGPPARISVTMSATSMTVIAIASTSVPNGSPTRCATTSAWNTPANTHAMRAATITSAYAPPQPSALPPSRSQPTKGTTSVQRGSDFIPESSHAL
jgi:predicted nucleic acid binding AN1-type Zn finger protein